VSDSARAECAAPDPAIERRSIRSFVLRQGRFSPAQKRAYEELMPRYGIAFARELLDLNAVFGREAPKILEIGFGMGETTAAIAESHPENDYLAIEVHTPGVGSLLKLIAHKELRNVRIIQHGAVDVLEQMIPGQSLHGAHIFFPDPWPKARHHKRRLIQPSFVALLAERLRPGALLHVATDWEDYATRIVAVLSNDTRLKNTVAGQCTRPAARPLTKFEQRGLRLGHRVWDIVFSKL